MATQGDAQALPYPDGAFDAAYLTVVLGEIPDQHAARGESQEHAQGEVQFAYVPDQVLVVWA